MNLFFFYIFIEIFELKKLIYFLIIFFLLSCKNTKQNLQAEHYYKNAKLNSKEGNSEVAFNFFLKAKKEYLLTNDSLGIGKSLVNMAIIQCDKSDFFGSIETSIEALPFLKKKDSLTKIVLASNYNCMAISSSDLKNYDNATKYYLKALEITDNQENKAVYYNNLGDNFLRQKNIEKAIEYFSKALENKDSINFARSINNLAHAKSLKNHNYNPLSDFHKSLIIREKINDSLSLNSSYATLSDYYFSKNNDSAFFYAKKMYSTASKIKSPDDELNALKKLIILDPKNYKEYFESFQSINDSLQSLRNKAKNQFALVRYDAEKEKVENAKNKIKILNRNIALSLSLLVIIIGILLFRKRKNRLEKEKEILKQEKEIEVKNTQIKYSKKIHDVVANGLYQTMVEVENQEELDKEKLLDKLEKMYEESRDIAHEDLNEQIEKEFSVKLFEMISSYSSPQQKVLVIGNEQNIWQNVSQNIQSEIFYALRELMINMKKHSQATLVSVKFEKIENILKIKYTDNGLGMGNIENKKLSGIKNTENRIENIGGDINFEKNLQKGLQVNISISIH